MGYDPTIKPAIYDLDLARYSVMRNAERLGIDPASIPVYLPLWEQGGVIAHNLGWLLNSDGVLESDSDPPVWSNGGVTLHGETVKDNRINLGAEINKILAGAANLTFISNQKWKDNSKSAEHCLWGNWDTNTGSVLLRIEPSVNDFEVFWYSETDTQGNVNWNSSFVMPEGVDSQVVFGFDLTAGCNVLAIDGDVHYSNGTYSAAFDSTVSTRDMYFGATPHVPDDGFNGDLYQGMILTQTLTESQITQLAETPYILLQKVARPVYFDLAAGGEITGSLSSNISVSGALPGKVGVSGAVSSSIDTLMSSTGKIGVSGGLSSSISSSFGSSGKIGVQGALNSLLAAMTGSFTEIGSVSGALTSTLEDFTSDLSGNIGVSGQLATAIADLVSELTGSVDGVVAGTLSGDISLAANIVGKLGVQGLLDAEVSLTADLLGKLGVSGALISQLADFDLSIVYVDNDSIAKTMLISTTSGKAVIITL